jgi:hypothetical protein
MNADQDSTDSSEKQETGNRGMFGLAFDFYVTNFTQLFLLVLQVFFLAYLAEEIFESDLILSLIYGAILAPLSVAVHRAIVLAEPLDASQYFPSFRYGRVWKFFGYGVLIALFGFLIVTLFSIIAGAGLFMGAMSDGSGSQFGVAILIVGIAIAVFMLLRFAFVWPAIATDQFQSLGDSARQMRGMTWKVLGALIMVVLPLIVVGFLAELIRFLSPVVDVANFLWIPMGPAVLSFAYISATAD